MKQSYLQKTWIEPLDSYEWLLWSIIFVEHQNLGGIDFQWRGRNLSRYHDLSFKDDSRFLGLKWHEGE